MNDIPANELPGANKPAESGDASAPAPEPSPANTEGLTPLGQNPAGTGERPEWLPEKFKTPEDLAKSYKELEGKLGKSADELRESLVKELENERLGNRPESADQYEIPDGVVGEEAIQNPLFNWWKDHAYENGFSQEQFEQGIKMYAEAQGDGHDIEAEKGKLGDNAEARINAANAFAAKIFPKGTEDAASRLMETASGVEALEAIQKALGDGTFSGNSGDSGDKLTQAKLEEMQRDPRYHDPARRDPHFVQQVQEGYAKLYGSS